MKGFYKNLLINLKTVGYYKRIHKSICSGTSIYCSEYGHILSGGLRWCYLCSPSTLYPGS